MIAAPLASLSRSRARARRALWAWGLSVVALATWACQAPSQRVEATSAAPTGPHASTHPSDLALGQAPGIGPGQTRAQGQPARRATDGRADGSSGLDEATLRARYAWLRWTPSLPKLQALSARHAPPAGFKRVDVAPDSFAAYLRDLPLRTDRDDVLLHTGQPVSMPSAGVVPLDLGPKDLHQCADSVIRLHAEFLWSQDRADEAQYHFTSGHLAAWKDWRRGKVWRVRGSKVTQAQGAAASDYKAFRRYLDDVFMYASTRSLHRDTRQLKGAKVKHEAGDFFLTAGSPGHVVLLLDVAEHADGRRAALIGQGYLPAREFHVIQGRGERVLEGVWFLLPDEQHRELVTPTWAPFPAERVWRFEAR